MRQSGSQSPSRAQVVALLEPKVTTLLITPSEPPSAPEPEPELKLTTDPYFDPQSFQKELDFHVKIADEKLTGKGRLFSRWR